MNKRSQSGFTIVELMIATMIFSMVLLLCAFAIVHIGRMYYKGVITNRTQDTARKITDDIVRAIQFGSKDEGFYKVGLQDENDDESDQSMCLGDIRYTFNKYKSLGDGDNQSRHVVWKDRINSSEGCDPVDLSQEEPTAGRNGVELLGQNMRAVELDVRGDEASNSWQVTVVVAYGDDEGLFEDDSNLTVCKGVNAGGQFCAVSSITTTVAKRL